MTGRLSVRTGLFIASLVAMLWGYRLMLLEHAPIAFSSPEEDMGYAWYVPLFSLYVLWTEREETFKTAGAPSWLGFFAMLVPMFLGFLGIRGSQLRLEILGFAGMLVALTWTFYGWRTARQVLFPAGFLCFCMPFNTYLDVVTVHLRLLGTSVAEMILQGVGADIVRRGTMLASADGSFSIDVASPCSGLRSLFAMMALTAGYAYFNHRLWYQRVLLFALSVPIAIFGNVVRILTIALVGTYADPEFALGFYHDYSGYVVFIVAIGCMVATSAAIARYVLLPRDRPPTGAAEPQKGGAK